VSQEVALLALSALAAIAYSAFVTRLVLRSPSYSNQQKWAQCILICLVPVAGAVVVHWFARHGATDLPPPEQDPFGRKNELPE
jgi:hypothetical protein